MKDRVKNFFSITWLIIVALITYTLRSQYFVDDFLKTYTTLNNSDIIKVREIILLIGFSIISIPGTIQIYLIKRSYNKKMQQNSKMLEHYKEMIINVLEHTVHKTNSNFKIRILVKCKALKILEKNLSDGYKINLHKSILFTVKDIPGFTDNEDIEGLFYEVYPKVQGIVGLCYKDKRIAYNFHMSETIEKYNLTKYQILKTSHIKFRVAAPIYNDKDEIKAILLIDSDKEITMDEKKEYRLFRFVNYLENFIEDNIGV